MIAVNFLDVCYNAIGKRTNYCEIIRKAKLCFETRNNTNEDFERMTGLDPCTYVVPKRDRLRLSKH